MIPDEAGAVGDGRLVLAGEDLLGDPSAKRGEDLQLARRGQAPRRQLGVREVALRPRVRAVEERAIRPLEVESVAERLAHPRVREDRAARVEDVALHPRGHLVLDLLLLDEPGGQGGAGVPCRPRLRRVLRTEVVLSGLERLQGHGGVAIVVVADDVEVAAPHPHGQPGAPVVLDAAIDDGAPGLQRLHAVRPAPQRRVKRRILEGARAPVRLREDG